MARSRSQADEITSLEVVLLATLRLRNLHFSLQKEDSLIAQNPGVRRGHGTILVEMCCRDAFAGAPNPAQHCACRPAVSNEVELSSYQVALFGLCEVVVGPLSRAVADIVDAEVGRGIRGIIRPVPDTPPLLEEGGVNLPEDLQVLGRADDGTRANSILLAGRDDSERRAAVNDTGSLVAEGRRVDELGGAVRVGSGS
ncbi:unnamed protein product [Clonostachys byssicola]|uniref:Uncharacterized protein n=1 Tax=Clonostachys byssicola TaxID=160290 RepID=A0A9N9UIV2_9HYPO|nr:unnamed protein product [Clonostachys byssicola]